MYDIDTIKAVLSSKESLSKIDKSHGSPFDRGEADSYYSRGRVPSHRMNGGKDCFDLTDQEVFEYYVGFEYNERMLNHKNMF